MPFIKVYIHFVWSTKNRFPFLNSKELREKMWKHIKDNGKEKGIFIDFVNGYSDHCHCLVSMKSDQTIQKVIQMIKGESAFWFNNQRLILEKFGWQDEYFAVSVSESMIENVRDYIKNQETHHSKKSFDNEYNKMIDVYDFQKFNDNDKPNQ